MDKIVLVYKKTDGSWATVDIFRDIPDGSTVDYNVSYDKVLIADGSNPCRYIRISKDLDIQYGDIGLDAPKIILTQDTSSANNAQVETDATDIGMGIEWGDILQYAITVEDKYGSESNPSPISTFNEIAYKYPDGTVDTGFTYYWYKTIIKGLNVRQYPNEIKEILKYYNIYRRTIPFREGIISNQFELVYRKSVNKNSDSQNYVDTSNANYGMISYDKGKSPSSELVKKTDNTIFLGRITSDVVTFQHKWLKYSEITITNDNQMDYINAIVAVVLSGEELGIEWSDYLPNNLNKVRIYHNDMTTPCPVLYKYDSSNNTIYSYIKIPQLDRETDNKIYLCFGDTTSDTSGVTDIWWDDYRYGKFFNIDDFSEEHQIMFEQNKVRSSNVRVSSSVLWESQSTAVVDNWANMNMGSKAYTVGGTTETEWELNQSTATDDTNIGYGTNTSATIIPVFEFGKMISNLGMKLNNKYIKYPSVSLTEKFMIVFDGVLNAGIKSGVIGNSVAKFTNFNLNLYRASGTNYTILKATVGSTTYTLRTFYLPTYSATYLRVVVYVNGGNLHYYVRIVNSLGTNAQTASGSVEISKITPNDYDVYVLYDSGGYLKKFEIYDDIDYTGDEFNRIAPSILYNTPIFKQQVGAEPFSPIGTWQNTSLTIANKEINSDNLKNKIVWSDVNGIYFNALNFKSFKEEVVAIEVAPSFLKMQYQNTIVVFTRNTVSRMPLTDDLNSMAGRSDNMVPEYQSGGAYAPKSVISISNAIFWFSENGVMMWSSDGIQNISSKIFDIPLSMDYIGMYIPSRNQYWLHNNNDNITYVYHITQGVWTSFTGLNIKDYANLIGGADTENKTMILRDDDIFNDYPNTEYADTDYVLKTKQYVLDNLRPIRYRVVWDKDSECGSITARTYGSKLGEQEVNTTNPSRFEWINLPNGFWGEYIEFEFNDVESLTRIDLDIKEGI